MAVFANLKTDDCVQLCDCIRLDASKSVIAAPHAEENVVTVEIAPNGNDYVTIHDLTANRRYKKEWYLDWCYETRNQSTVDSFVQEMPTSITTITTNSSQIGQSYVVDMDSEISYVEIHLRSLTANTGNVTAEIRSDDNIAQPQAPGSLLATSGVVLVGDLPSDTTTLTRFTFAQPLAVTAGQTVHFVFRVSGIDGILSSNFEGVDFYPEGGRSNSSNDGGTFSVQQTDLSFAVGLTAMSEEGVVKPSVRITLDDGTVSTKETCIELKTAEEDCLFSNDQDLVEHEHDILEWLPDGRSSFIYIHRRAKERIFKWLEERGFKDCNGEAFTKEDVFDREEFREWSRFLALRLIFGFISNSNGDIYEEKYKDYCRREAESRTRMYSLDMNGDGIDSGKKEDMENLSRTFLVRG